MADMVELAGYDYEEEERRARVYRPLFQPTVELTNLELYSRYRFDRNGIHLLTNLLRDELEHPTGRSRAISAEMQILVSLRYLATGSFQNVVSDTFSMAQSSISRCITRFTNALTNHIHQFVRFPTEEESRVIRHEFYTLNGFPSVVGCIDGTHVRILTPSANPNDYINRKHYHSINVQAICDHNGAFTNIVARWPGSSHDSWILRQSAIWHQFEAGNHIGYLLGDAGYPCKPWLLTPYPNPNNQAAHNFNNSHKRTRVLIEQVFGRWKRRFGILHGEIRTTPEKACKIIASCAILHNIAIQQLYPDNFENVVLEDGNNDIYLDGHNNGNAFRDAVAMAHFI